MAFTEDEIKSANRTYRCTGIIGPNAILPRLVPQFAKKSYKILDYGAGKLPNHANALRKKGYDVTAHDFGLNFVEGVHDPNALKRKYDLIYASNVMNVQGSQKMATETLNQISKSLKPEGIFLVNYPSSPRHLKHNLKPLDTQEFEEELLKHHFTYVKRLKGTSSPVWVCKL